MLRDQLLATSHELAVGLFEQYNAHVDRLGSSLVVEVPRLMVSRSVHLRLAYRDGRHPLPDRKLLLADIVLTNNNGETSALRVRERVRASLYEDEFVAGFAEDFTEAIAQSQDTTLVVKVKKFEQEDPQTALDTYEVFNPYVSTH